MLRRNRGVFGGCLPLLLVGASAWAEAPEVIPTAPVVIDGEELFSVRGTSALPAPARAQRITGRIQACADSPEQMPGGLSIVPHPLGLMVRCGEADLFVVVDADAALEGLSTTVLAEVQKSRIEAAIAQYRAERTRDALLRAAGRAAAALAALVVTLVLLTWLFRRVDRRLEAVLHERVKGVSVQSFQVLRAETIWRLLRWLLRTLQLSLVVATLFAGTQYALAQFPWTRGASRAVAGAVLGPLGNLALGVLHTIPGVLLIGVVIYLSRSVLRVVAMFFTAVDEGKVTLKSFEREWAMPSYRLVRLLLIGLTLVVIYPYIPGSDSSAFKGLSLLFGLLLSLGGSSYVSNMIAGYTMTFRRAFRVGERIRVGDVAGVVTESRLQVTHLRTMKNEEIVVPNNVILASAVTNYSVLARANALLLHTNVGIGYETPWRQVEAMLLLAARRACAPEHAEKAFVLLRELGDYAVTYELNVPHGDAMTMERQYSALHRHLLDVFNEFGVQIMTPSYVADTPAPKLVPKDQWYLAPAAPPAPAEPEPGPQR